MITLKRCPFCGATPEQPACYVKNETGRWGMVECTGCNARGPEVRVLYLPDPNVWAAEAAEEWNTRAQEETA